MAEGLNQSVSYATEVGETALVFPELNDAYLSAAEG